MGIIHERILSYDGEYVPFVIKTTKEMKEISRMPHSHSYYVIFFASESSGFHLIDGKKYSITEGCLYFVKPGQIHQFINLKRETLGTLLLFTPEFISSEGAGGGIISRLDIFNASVNPLIVSGKAKENIELLYGKMMDEFVSDNKFRLASLEACLRLFLIECNNLFLSGGNAAEEGKENENAIVRAFKNLVEEHFNDWRLVKTYADELKISSNYLSEVIKRHTGLPPKNHINSRIALEAKRLILYSGKSVKEIGYGLGFNDPARFSRFFKTVSGMSFRQFINSANIKP